MKHLHTLWIKKLDEVYMCYSIEADLPLFRKFKMFLLYPVLPSATAEEESLGQPTHTSTPALSYLTIPWGMMYLHSFTMDKELSKSDELRYAADLANICKQSIYEITREGSNYISYTASKDFYHQISSSSICRWP